MAGTRKERRRRLGRITSGAAFAFVLALALLALGPALIGWKRYAIVSGSMTGTYDKGSLVLDEVVPVGELRVGDVITYMPPAGDHLITRRIAWIGRDVSGARVFRTKGDANPVADGWTFRLDRPTQARVRAWIPYAGYALSALGRRDVRMGLIALPVALIAAFSLAGLWRRLGAMEATA